jgi:hypothetical protein
MSRREDRARRIAGWLEHLQSWKASGEALSAYARSHGVEPGSMYYWRNVLRREGHWPQEPGEPDGGQKVAAASGSTRVPLRFARVRFEHATGGPIGNGSRDAGGRPPCGGRAAGYAASERSAQCTGVCGKEC